MVMIHVIQHELRMLQRASCASFEEGNPSKILTCRVLGLITRIFAVSLFMQSVVVLCAWLCFDSSPRARCPCGCVSTSLVSLLISSSSLTMVIVHLVIFPFIAPRVSLSFVKLLWFIPLF